MNFFNTFRIKIQNSKIINIVRLLFLKFPTIRFAISIICLLLSICILGTLSENILSRPILTFWIILVAFLLFVFGLGLLILYFLAEFNRYYFDSAYTSLADFVNKNDIGNATFLVKSLSANEEIRKYFNTKYTEIKAIHKENDRNFRVTPRYKFLVGTIPDLVDQIDNATIDTLLFLEQYIDFEPKNISTKKKIADMFFSTTFIAGIMAALKYGIDFLDNENMASIGMRIIYITIAILFCGLGYGLWLHRKNAKEQNARNFLLLVFKCIKEKQTLNPVTEDAYSTTVNTDLL